MADPSTFSRRRGRSLSRTAAAALSAAALIFAIGAGGIAIAAPQAGGAPSAGPTAAPSTTPSVAPTTTPSAAPTTTPSVAPTTTPSAAPSTTPSVAPTTTPSVPPELVPADPGTAAALAAAAAAAASQNPPDLPDPEPTQPAEPPPTPLSDLPYFPLNLSFIYPIAANATQPTLLTNLDIALVVSRIGAVVGLQTGVLTYTEFEVRGLQASVAAISGKTTGAQIGAAFSFADGDFRGLQLSGVLGWSDGEHYGAQIAGVANQSFKAIHGLQLAAGVNIARGEVHGVQAAGILNIGRVDGLQFGIINVSAEVKGLQLGLFNIARKVDGAQVGLINITDTVSGESLGLANILKPGSIHLSVWGSNSINGNIGVKFASKYAYSIFSAAAHAEEQPNSDKKKAAFGAGLTLGLRWRRPFNLNFFALNGDIGGYRLFPSGSAISGHDEIAKARAYLSFELAGRLTLFAGGGVYMGFRGDKDVAVRVGPEGFGGVDF